MKKKITIFTICILLLTFISSCSEKVTVKFDTDGGSLIENVEIKRGKTVDKPTDPVKENYIFVRWEINEQEYDFSRPVQWNITLKAVWEKVYAEELVLAEELIRNFKTIETYEKSKEKLAFSMYKHNINIEELEQMSFSAPKQFLDYAIENNKITDFISFLLQYFDIVLELSYLQNLNETITLPQDAYNYAVFNYEFIKKEGYYTSSYSNFTEDTKYSGFIIPVMYCSLTSKRDYDDARIWLKDAIVNGYLKYFDVEQQDDSVIFTNNITKTTFNFTYQELKTYIDAFNHAYFLDSSFVLLTSYYRVSYKKYMILASQKQFINKLQTNDEEIESIINNQVSNLAKSIENIYKSYNIIMGLESKYNSLIQDFETYNNKEDLRAAIINAINFKDQLVLELKDALAQMDIINDLEDIYDAFGVDLLEKDIVLTEEFLIKELDVFGTYFVELIELANDLVVVLEQINTENYDIDVVVDAILNSNFEDEDFLNQANKLEDKLYDVIGNSKLLQFNSSKIYNLAGLYTELDNYSLKNLCEVVFGDLITEELLCKLEDKLTNVKISYSKEEIKSIIKYIEIINGSKENITDENIHDLSKIMDKLISCIDAQTIDILKECLIEAMYFIVPQEQYHQRESFINILMENIDGLKTYLTICYHGELYTTLANKLLYAELTFSKRTQKIGYDLLQYLQTISVDDLNKMVTLFKEVNEAIDFVEVDTTVINDLKEYINNSVIIFENNTTLTSAQKDYINALLVIFKYQKIY